MTTRIQSIDVQTTRFDPVEAEVTVTVAVAEPAADLELRGRLMGPSCPYTDTIEVAYPLKPLPSEGDLLRARAVIPEASPWEPATPFLYRGPVELWQADQMVEHVQVVHGLRHLLLKKGKLLLNGKRLKIRGVRGERFDEDQAARLREAQCNLLLAQTRTSSEPRYEAADRLGFFVLGQVTGEDDEVLWHAAEKLAPHPSCFGWLLPQTLIAQPQLWHNAMSLLQAHRKVLIGLHVEDLPLGVLPGHIAFIVCAPRLLEELAEQQVPKLVLARSEPVELPDATNLLGWIARELAAE